MMYFIQFEGTPQLDHPETDDIDGAYSIAGSIDPRRMKQLVPPEQ